MDSVREYIGQLVRLKTDGGKLQLDRDYWAQQFDNRSIQELVKETNRNLAKLNMPTNYDPDPLFELGSVSHPQAIFAKMRSTMQKKQKSSSVYYYSYNRTSSSSLNRQFNNNDLNVRMNFEPNSTVTRRVASKPQDAKPPKLDGKPFKLEFNETKDSRRSLIVHELTDGRLRVSLVTEKSNAFVQMLQKPEGEFVLQDVRGPEIFTAKAKSFDTFRETHANYCNEKLFPLFSHFGIRFSDQLFKAPPRPDTPEKKPEASDTKKASKAQAIKKIRTLEATPRLVIPKPPR